MEHRHFDDVDQALAHARSRIKQALKSKYAQWGGYVFQRIYLDNDGWFVTSKVHHAGSNVLSYGYIEAHAQRNPEGTFIENQ